ncbi:MAG TPA: hypothetical protein VHY35_25635 [Stellaceae bacterium]|jgi:hypothetical protein|nr:hypothetical protein [Stellaceae bacterium]
MPDEIRTGTSSAYPIGLVLGLLFFESVLFLLFTTTRLDAWLYLTIHLSLCAMIAGIGFLPGRRFSSGNLHDKAAIGIQISLWAVFAGPFGAVMGLILIWPQRSDAAHDHLGFKDEDESDSDSNLARLDNLHGLMLDRRLRIQNAHCSRSLLDVVFEGTRNDKLEALSLISKRFTPSLVPALRRSLEDRDGSVRVLAATVLAQQHNMHTKRLGALQAKANAAPASADDWTRLGQAHLDYAQSGLLETSRANVELNQARAAFEHVEHTADPDPSARRPT